MKREQTITEKIKDMAWEKENKVQNKHDDRHDTHLKRIRLANSLTISFGFVVYQQRQTNARHCPKSWLLKVTDLFWEADFGLQS